jgi:hypothetical protein
LRPRRQMSGAPASLAKIVAARSLLASLRRLRIRTTLLAACSNTYSPIRKVLPCQHSRCHSIPAFGQRPQRLSLRLHSVPITRSTWHEGRKLLGLIFCMRERSKFQVMRRVAPQMRTPANGGLILTPSAMAGGIANRSSRRRLGTNCPRSTFSWTDAAATCPLRDH